MIPIINDLFQENYNFLITKSSLLKARCKEHDLTIGIMLSNKIPLTVDGDFYRTNIYDTIKLNYHPPNDNQHRTHKVVA